VELVAMDIYICRSIMERAAAEPQTQAAPPVPVVLAPVVAAAVLELVALLSEALAVVVDMKLAVAGPT
jgi:hypothetical protein